MPSLRDKIEDTEVPEKSKELARRMSDEFSESILLEAKLCAVLDGSELVLPKHVHEAAGSVKGERSEIKKRRELRVALGGALLGAFIQGFITELGKGNQVLVVVYTVLGLLGMFLVLVDFRR